jgi:hypothetical protein
MRPARVAFVISCAVAATVVAATVVVLRGEDLPAGSRPGTVRVHWAGTDGLPDSYLVILRDSPAKSTVAVDPMAHDLVARYGGTLAHLYTSVMRGFSVRMSAAQAIRLATDPHVAHVQQNSIVYAAGAQPGPPTAWRPSEQRKLPPRGPAPGTPNVGNPVTVYVMDTGIRTTHRDLDGRAVHGWDFVDGDPIADDCGGRGTHMAGVVHAVAPSAELVAVRVLGCDGTATTAEALAGIDWITQRAARPATALVGFSGGTGNLFLAHAVQVSSAASILYTVAAVQDNACVHAPALVADALAVGVREHPVTSAPATSESCLDSVEPDRAVVSADAASDTAVAARTGVAVAAARIAGAVAVALRENPDLDPARLNAIWRATKPPTTPDGG